MGSLGILEAFFSLLSANASRTFRGVWVRSRAEYMIDNWFAVHGIVTYYEKALYINSTEITPDGYIPSVDTYVEFLGLKGDTNYDKIWEKKEQAYRLNSLKYVILLNEDLADLDRSIPDKIPQLKAKGFN